MDWERAAFAAIYPANPIPVGVPLLGSPPPRCTTLRRCRCGATTARRLRRWPTAAHDVLVDYALRRRDALDTQLATTLAGVADGDAEDLRGAHGKKVAARLIEERADDGYGDTTIHYTLPPAIGTWQPAPPATDMLGAWIGSMDPLVVRRLAKVDGPDKLTSDDYATDYTEVKLLGSATSTVRSQAQTDTARFFSANAATTIGDALVRYLEANPVSLEDTAWTFAAMHGAMTDSLIKCWQLKRDVGFWRPVEAVPAAGDDGNPDTRPGGRVDTAPGAHAAVLRLRQRSRLRHLSAGGGDQDPVRRNHPLELVRASSRPRAPTPPWSSSSSTPSTPASGAGSTSATRCPTRTASGDGPHAP